ncbi:MAG: cyclic-di-AMP receptor [Tissierella sp.]|uniref:cyclic-di-AMP receptor n=1 Tax=Tissierella sp. TaxID=41274 RepID=UPI003F97C78B
MKLIIAIIQDEYVNKVIRTLMDNKIRTTRLSSTGGFLKSGNTTLLIGTEEEEIDHITELIGEQTKIKKIKEGKEEIIVGGANLFVVDIHDHIRL